MAITVVGEVWRRANSHPHGVAVTMQYFDPENVYDDGTPVLWIEFGSKTLTYNYRELADLGWERVTPELT